MIFEEEFLYLTIKLSYCFKLLVQSTIFLIFILKFVQINITDQYKLNVFFSYCIQIRNIYIVFQFSDINLH
jgi:hypothetical protein